MNKPSGIKATFAERKLLQDGRAQIMAGAKAPTIRDKHCWWFPGSIRNQHRLFYPLPVGYRSRRTVSMDAIKASAQEIP